MTGCATPEPGETIEAMLERMQSAGAIGVDDADTVAEFAEFLRDMGPAGPDGDRSRQRRALLKHAAFCGLSADDIAKLEAAEGLEPRGRAICPDCVAGKHVNCLGDALDPVTDEIVRCACDHNLNGGAP